MNEQQLADLFSEQVDRLLAGDAVADVPGLEDWPELTQMGEQLAQTRFQPTPVAQTAFDSLLAGWFGPPVGGAAGGSAAPFLGMSKNLLLGVVAAITAIGGGVGLMLLTGTPLLGLFSFDPGGELSVPATTESSPSVMPESPAEPILDPVEANDLPPNPTPSSSPASSGDTLPDTNFSHEDTLPSATPDRGDTLPTATASPTISPTLTPTSTATRADPVEGPPQNIDDEPNSTDPEDGPATGPDDDRGHGNDPDRYDEDNPGQSTGAGPNDNQGGGSSGGGGGGKGGGRK